MFFYSVGYGYLTAKFGKGKRRRGKGGERGGREEVAVADRRRDRLTFRHIMKWTDRQIGKSM